MDKINQDFSMWIKPLSHLLFAGLLMLLAAPRLAADDTQTDAYARQVQQMYVAYYGRPGDPGGVEYWAGRLAEVGGNWIADLVNAFGTSEEYTEGFGELSAEILIDNLYRQLFNRTAEPAGRGFYIDLLNGTNDSGLNPSLRWSTLAEIALDIANGAQNLDLKALEQKLQVASYFTAEILRTLRPYQSADIGAAGAILNLADSSDESLGISSGAVDDFIAGTPTGLIFDEIRLGVRVASTIATQMVDNAEEILEGIILNARCSFTSSLATSVILEAQAHRLTAQGELALYQGGERLTCARIFQMQSISIDRAELQGDGALTGPVAHGLFAGDFDIDGRGYPLLEVTSTSLFIADYYYVDGSGTLSDLRYQETDYPDISWSLTDAKVDIVYVIDLAEQILRTGSATFGEMASAIVDGNVRGASAHCDQLVVHFTGEPVVEVSASCTSPGTFFVDVDTAEIWW